MAKLIKKPLRISELVGKLEEMKKDLGDVECWMYNQNDVKVGQDVEFESVGSVNALKVAQNDSSHVLLLAGVDYLKA